MGKRSLHSSLHQAFILALLALCLIPFVEFAHADKTTNCASTDWAKFSPEYTLPPIELHSTDALIRSWEKYFPTQMQSAPADLSKVIQFNEAIISSFAHSESQGVRLTGEHLQEITQAIIQGPEKTRRLNRLGFNRDAFLIGAYSSDKGKDHVYSRLLTLKAGDPDATPAALAESDRMIDFLRGHSRPTLLAADGKSVQSLGTEKTVAALKELFQEVGLPTTYFNPNASTEEIKNVIRKVNTLQGFFHELPGLRDLSYLLELGYINKETFKNSLRHDIGHNGPKAGFWRFLTDQIIAKQAAALGASDELAHIAEKGIFSGKFVVEADGKKIYQLNYPDMQFSRYSETEALSRVTSATKNKGEILGLEIGPVLHQVSDRLSVATRNGFLKISQEINIAKSPNPISGIYDLIIGNPVQSLDQLNAIKRQIVEKKISRLATIKMAHAEKKISNAELNELNNLVLRQVQAMQQANLQAIRYVEAYLLFARNNLHFNAEKNVLQIRIPGQSTLEYRVVNADDKIARVQKFNSGKWQDTNIEELMQVLENRLDAADAQREIRGYTSSLDAFSG